LINDFRNDRLGDLTICTNWQFYIQSSSLPAQVQVLNLFGINYGSSW
jgi:hypothetical protein